MNIRSGILELLFANQPTDRRTETLAPFLECWLLSRRKLNLSKFNVNVNSTNKSDIIVTAPR
jgi:hypothetical protein